MQHDSPTINITVIMKWLKASCVPCEIVLNCVFVGVFQKTIESETVKTSEVLKKTLGTISETVKEVGITAISGCSSTS